MMAKSAQTSVYLFAHQDDEFGLMHQIEHDLSNERKVVVAYLTTGTKKTLNPSKRNQESLRVLTNLGVLRKQVIFAGEILGVADGQLLYKLPEISAWLREQISIASTNDRIYIPAWEGGHPDHDGLHAAAVHTWGNSTAKATLRQYPLYNADGCRAPWFKVLTPLSANGVASCCSIPWRSRVRHLRLMLSYSSQWKSWLGLFPFTFWHYLSSGVQSIQYVDPNRIKERPHAGVLYYEHRRFSTWHEINAAIISLTSPPRV